METSLHLPQHMQHRYRRTCTDTLIQTHGHTHASFPHSLFLQVSCWPSQLWYGVCAKCPAPLLLSTTGSCLSHPQRSYETGGQFIYFVPMQQHFHCFCFRSNWNCTYMSLCWSQHSFFNKNSINTLLLRRMSQSYHDSFNIEDLLFLVIIFYTGSKLKTEKHFKSMGRRHSVDVLCLTTLLKFKCSFHLAANTRCSAPTKCYWKQAKGCFFYCFLTQSPKEPAGSVPFYFLYTSITMLCGSLF